MSEANIQRSTLNAQCLTKARSALNVGRWTLSVGRLLLLILATSVATAQVPDSPRNNPPPVAPAPQQSSNQPASSPASSGGGGKFLGKDVPIFDPANEIVTWDGHSWNLNNNRIFEARFEKYLNAPEDTSAQSREYQGILATILDRLSPEKLSTKSVDEA